MNSAPSYLKYTTNFEKKTQSFPITFCCQSRKKIKLKQQKPHQEINLFLPNLVAEKTILTPNIDKRWLDGE